MTPTEREILIRAAKSQCLRCEFQGEPEYIVGDGWVHGAYTTPEGTGIPPEPCDVEVMWCAIADIDALDQGGEAT